MELLVLVFPEWSRWCDYFKWRSIQDNDKRDKRLFVTRIRTYLKFVVPVPSWVPLHKHGMKWSSETFKEEIWQSDNFSSLDYFLWSLLMEKMSVIFKHLNNFELPLLKELEKLKFLYTKILSNFFWKGMEACSRSRGSFFNINCNI